MTGAQLGLDFDAPRLVRVTPARLGTWDDCPRRYRLTYLDRPAPVRSGARGGEHAWARSSTSRCGRSSRCRPQRRTPRGGGRAGRPALVERGLPGRRAGRTTTGTGRGAGLPTTREGAAEVDAVGLEQWVSVAVGGIVAEGRVDRIDRRGDELVVVDYKTGRAPTPEDARGSPGARPLRRWAPSARCGGAASRWSCTTCRAARSRRGGTTAPRWQSTSPRRSVPRPQLAAAADDLEAGADPEARFPARPRLAAAPATCGGTAPRAGPRHRRASRGRSWSRERAREQQSDPASSASPWGAARPVRRAGGGAGRARRGAGVAWVVALRAGSPGPGAGTLPCTPLRRRPDGRTGVRRPHPRPAGGGGRGWA